MKLSLNKYNNIQNKFYRKLIFCCPERTEYGWNRYDFTANTMLLQLKFSQEEAFLCYKNLISIFKFTEYINETIDQRDPEETASTLHP